MLDAPATLDNAKVLYYTLLDKQHQPTGNTVHSIGEKVVDSFFALAICQYEGSQEFYLFYCDDLWNVVTDTLHQTLKQAIEQAEFEYKGINQTWKFVGSD